MHNESMNIFTHLFGALLFLGLSVSHTLPYETLTWTDVWVWYGFFAGAIACLSLSSVYHTICCHSEGISRNGNKLDYIGIVALTVLSFLPSLHYGFACFPTLRNVYWTMIVSLGALCISISVFDRFRSPELRSVRTAMFVALGVSGVIPIIHGRLRYTFLQMHDLFGLGWVLLQGCLYIIGALIYAWRIPERWAPGKFDIYFGSHQIFHCFVVAAAFTQWFGLHRAAHFRHSNFDFCTIST
jgi:adiponectin receptor